MESFVGGILEDGPQTGEQQKVTWFDYFECLTLYGRGEMVKMVKMGNGKWEMEMAGCKERGRAACFPCSVTTHPAEIICPLEKLECKNSSRWWSIWTSVNKMF